MKVSGAADRVFLVYTAILVVFGLVALVSASGPMGYAKFQDHYFFVKRQLLFGLIPGLIAFIFFAKVNIKFIHKYSMAFYGLSIVLLCLVFLPGLGITLNNSRSWLQIGGFSFQPSELAKLTVSILLAYLLTVKERNWDDWQGSILPVLSVVAPALLLVLLQPDLGTASIICAIIFVMLYIARVPSRYLVMMGLAGVLAFVILVLVAPYRTQRLTTFLHPELDPKGVGYHINQAFLAVGSGGFWGLGYGNSRQKFQYLPEVNADSIYAIIAEEMGFVISTGLVILILLISYRGFKIARGAPDMFSGLLVSGIMVWFTLQAFLNIGAMVGALPLTGVPLPFVSHGGSAMITMFAAFGIVANVSKQAKLGN